MVFYNKQKSDLITVQVKMEPQEEPKPQHVRVFVEDEPHNEPKEIQVVVTDDPIPGRTIRIRPGTSRAKRGRPTAAAKHQSEEYSQSIKNAYADRTTRTHAAIFYRCAAFSVLSEAASDIPFIEGIYRNNGGGLFDKAEITEQLGRILRQDNQSKETVLQIATLAAKYYHEGSTVKQIKAWILQTRKEWRK